VLSIVVCSLRRRVQRPVCLVVFSPSSQIVVNTLVCLLIGGEDYGLFSCLLRYIYVCVAQPWDAESIHDVFCISLTVKQSIVTWIQLDLLPVLLWLLLTLAGTNRNADMDFSSWVISISSGLTCPTLCLDTACETSCESDSDVFRFLSLPSCSEDAVADMRRLCVFGDRSIDICLSIPSLTM
jgi:hypothetical protein